MGKKKRFDFTARNRRGQMENCGYLDMETATDNKPASLLFYGDIVSTYWDAWTNEDKYPQAIADFMNSLTADEPLEIHFNSGGGDVFAGVAIYNLLARHTGQKVGYVDGLAASIASAILMASDEINFSTGAQVMIHKPWTWGAGNADDLRSLADRLDGAENSIVDIYMNKAVDGKTREDFQTAMRAETWMDQAKAAEYFRIKTADTAAAAPAASVCYGLYKHTPEAVKAFKSHQEEQKRRQEREQAILGDLWKYGT